MDTTFKIIKANRKADLINFISKLCKWEVKTSIDNELIEIGKTPVFVTYGKTYIRIQDTKDDPAKITQLFYDTPLDYKKYADNIAGIVKSSLDRIVEKKNIQIARNEYLELFSKFMDVNKYQYEPYTIDRFEAGDEIYTFISDNNFSVDIYLNSDKKLKFAPQINKKIIQGLSPVSVADHTVYISIIDATVKKIEKLKKVMSLIINDINKVVDANINKK